MNKIAFPTGSDDLSDDAAHLVKSAGLSGEVQYARAAVTKGFAGCP